ncbi:hypothetical protein [Chitinophaga pinensis]|nr:hypothetical protein [Chitinophaga pinensis]
MRVFTLLIVSSFYSCVSSKQRLQEMSVFCKKLDTLELERMAPKNSNYYANLILPELERRSDISANCEKGFFGYMYLSDSLFNADMKRWRAYFKCK